jgi:hypothetical protein
MSFSKTNVIAAAPLAKTLTGAGNCHLQRHELIAVVQALQARRSSHPSTTR